MKRRAAHVMKNPVMHAASSAAMPIVIDEPIHDRVRFEAVALPTAADVAAATKS